MRVIRRIISWFKCETGVDHYLRGFQAGAAFTRQYGHYPPFWAYERSIDYDAFDRGWDDGVRFVLAQREAKDGAEA